MAVFQVKEYGKIRSVEDFKVHKNSDADIAIDEFAFASIWSYILEFQSKDPSVEKAFKLLTKNGKKQIQVQNFVGIIETQNKTVIEILPKIYSQGGELSINKCKKIFLKLIASLHDIPYINLQQASLEAEEDFPILELFINNFIVEIEHLVLIGIKKGYVVTDQNSNFLKGQLLFSKDILKNLIDKSRFYTRFNQYLTDIPQNRILKTALQKLHNISVSSNNKSRIHNLISIFSEIGYCRNIDKDLQLSKNSTRLFSAYEKALLWSELFLLDKGFTSFSGNKINQAILFPMEKLFESFVAKQFKKYTKSHHVHSQDSRHYLVDDHGTRSKFRLKPDLYLQNIEERRKDIVIDTKWKIINQNIPEKNYLISQSDMYQLFAYGKKYSQSDKVVQLFLIYPMNEYFQKGLSSFIYEKKTEGNLLELLAVPFDLSGNYENQVTAILSDTVFIS
jgi:5-methylcytosine-specific restriction enzyme subunit McrC